MAIACIAAGLLVAGCGGDDSDGGSADASDSGAVTVAENSEISKADFVKEGNAICDAAIKKLRSLIDAEKGDYIQNTINALQTEVDEISELGAPNGDQEQVEAILDSAQQTVLAVEKDRKNIEPANKHLATAEKLAAEYGLKKCLLS